jgi:hypothetical protein
MPDESDGLAAPDRSQVVQQVSFPPKRREPPGGRALIRSSRLERLAAAILLAWFCRAKLPHKFAENNENSLLGGISLEFHPTGHIAPMLRRRVSVNPPHENAAIAVP